MFKAVLVDDEKPALRELEFLLKRYGEIEIAGAYTDPFEAIKAIGVIKPQAVFLDINMPQLYGIETALRIQEISSDTEIIFATAYDKYAIEAFELHALDYILKPVSRDRLDKTVERLVSRKSRDEEKTGRQLKVRCLGRFQLAWDNCDPVKWRAEKTKEIFAFLLQNRDRDISKDELLETLWPETDPDKAIRQLYNGIYYIRKALSDYGVSRDQISIGSDYNMKVNGVEIDVDRFLELVKTEGTENRDDNLEMSSLYAGDYLEGDYFDWAEGERDRLQKLYVQFLLKSSKILAANREWERAEADLLTAYGKNPYEESVTELLLKLYSESGNKNKAAMHLNAYSKLIWDELGVMADPRLRDMIK